MFWAIFLIAWLAIEDAKHNQIHHEGANQAGSDEKEKESIWRPVSWEPITTLTWVLALVGSGQAVLFLWQLRLIRDGSAEAIKAADAAKDSAEVARAQIALARDEFIVSHRPWVSATITPTTDLTFEGEDRDGDEAWVRTARFDVCIRLENHGDAPAINVLVQMRMIRAGIVDPHSIQDEMFEFMSDKSRRGPGLFPSATLKTYERVSLDQVFINPDKDFKSPPRHRFEAYVVGTICYDFAIGGQGRTDFVYGLATSKPGRFIMPGYGWIIDVRNGTVDKGDFVLASMGGRAQ